MYKNKHDQIPKFHHSQLCLKWKKVNLEMYKLEKL